MFKSLNIIFTSLVFSLTMMSTASKAATIDFYAEDLLYFMFGSPVDWENIPGTYDVSNLDSNDHLIHYNHIPLSFHIPQGSMADLTITYTTFGHNQENTQELGSWVLTDENGMLNDFLFAILLEAYQCIELEITHTWLGQGELIPNPLPPSVVVFMTAMLSVGYLARRRRNKTV